MTSTLSIKKDLQIKTKSAYSIIDANPINRPIGVFDSGIGGLTVVKEIFRQLPHEEVVYFGDTGRFPMVSALPRLFVVSPGRNINFLLEQNVKWWWSPAIRHRRTPGLGKADLQHPDNRRYRTGSQSRRRGHIK
jgi:hypothetical protein